MNNKVKTWSAICLTAVYCFAVIHATYSLKKIDFRNHQTTEQEQYLATIAKGLYCHTSSSENAGSSLNNSSVSKTNNVFDELWSSVSESREQLFEAKFTQYCNFAINFLIKYRKTDIIFPFHYFW
jgi:cytochrome c-type biogenesis protein CcmH/NrfF